MIKLKTTAQILSELESEDENIFIGLKQTLNLFQKSYQGEGLKP